MKGICPGLKAVTEPMEVPKQVDHTSLRTILMEWSGLRVLSEHNWDTAAQPHQHRGCSRQQQEKTLENSTFMTAFSST